MQAKTKMRIPVCPVWLAGLAAAAAWAVAGTGFGQIPGYMKTYTNTFDTDLGRWTTEYGNRANNNDYGWSDTGNAAGSPGEAGGILNPGGPLSYLADANLVEWGTASIDANVMPLRIRATLVITNINWNRGISLGYYSAIDTAGRASFSVGFSEPAGQVPGFTRCGVGFLGAGSGTYFVPLGPPDNPTRIEVDVQWNPLTRRITGFLHTNVIDFEYGFNLTNATRALFTHFALGCFAAQTASNLVSVYVDNVAYNLAPDLVPGAPSNLNGVGTDSPRVDLSWLDEMEGEEGYVIERSPDNLNWMVVGYAPANAQEFSDIDPTLMPNTFYYYRVRAYRTNEVTEYASCSVVTGVYPARAQKPKSISFSHRTPTSLRLRWANADPPGGNATEGFVLQRKIGGDWVTVCAAPATTLEFIDNTVDGGTTNEYRIAATNGYGFSAFLELDQGSLVQGRRQKAITQPQFLGVVDNFNTLTRAARQTGWQIVTLDAAPEWNDDPALAERLSDEAEAELVYFLPNQQVTRFNLWLFFRIPIWDPVVDADKLKVYVSADGVTWTEVATALRDLEDKGNDWGAARLGATEPIPAGCPYFKVVAQPGFGAADAIRLSRLEIDPPLVDEFISTLTLSRSNISTPDGSGSENNYWDERGAGPSSLGSAATLVYEVPNVNTFALRIRRHTVALSKVRDQLYVEVSPDNDTWTIIPKRMIRQEFVSLPYPSGGGYNISDWGNDAEIPPGMNYLRVRFPANFVSQGFHINLHAVFIGTNGYVNPAPKLAIDRAGTNAVVSWQGGGYFLQWANSLTDPVSWTTNIVDGWWDMQVTQPANQPQRYYRLLKR